MLRDKFSLFIFFVLLFITLTTSSTFGKPISTAQAFFNPIAEYYVHNPEDQTPIPFFQRKNHTFILSQNELQRSTGGWDYSARLRAKLEIARKKERPLTVVAIGGSITSGQGCSNGHSWPLYLQYYLEDYFPGSFKVHNGAMGGITSNYMNVCHKMHVESDADIIFVEFSVNDIVELTPLFDNTFRKCFERMIRKLLSYPRSPAVVLLHAYSHIRQKNFYNSAENELSVFGDYYSLPQLSVRNAVLQRFLLASPGFWVNRTVEENVTYLSGRAFYFDGIHPDGWVGSRVMAELPIYLFNRTLDSLAAAAAGKSEDELAAAAEVLRREALMPIPVPAIPGNRQSNDDTCLIGMSFRSHVIETRGFEWINEAQSSSRPKWGYVAKTPGSTMRMRINSDVLLNLKPNQRKQEIVLVQIAHLKSYIGMGAGQITCVSGCSCTGGRMEGHWTERSSQVTLHAIRVTPHPECVIQVEVLPVSRSLDGGTKVKVTGVVIIDDMVVGGRGIMNFAALEYTADISIRGNGTFDIKNHAL